ncbi:hypothetical protein SAMN04487830_103119 [Pseudobutyrivibrio sp. OR37]|uniref:hypothetical protein n=1 Tax=Pseudobutyrivibrio sp. OR37 TaxID=1798186 RepID=UPI0008F26BC2|nr:hypothetical protein [Pseudobutyrivibrio sp. OR37]SFH62690.1 hypothetical protein SAMN04487830_103119 [Pseudobutyrivibrio sp. OR37]
MSISPINFNGMIQNTNEISHTKASEDQKPLLQQSALTDTVEKQQEKLAHQVNDTYNAKRTEDSLDREGNGKGYEGNKKRRPPKDKKDEKLQGDGTVTEKTTPSFDIRI